MKPIFIFLRSPDAEHTWDESETVEDTANVFAEQESATTSIAFDGGCYSLLIFPLIAVFLLVTGLLLGSGSANWYAQESVPQQALIIHNPPPGENEAASNPGAHTPGISPLFTPEVLYWQESIMVWSEERDLDPNLVATIMQIESCGDPTALSRAGAQGLFQVMPYHFAWGENPYNPNTNAVRGLSYLLETLEAKNGDSRLALAAYNGGISGTKGLEIFWPAETQRYVHWGENIYQDARQNKLTSATLLDWLGHGGSSLCQQARQQLDLTP